MPFPTVIERYGSLSATGLAKETVFGTPVAATTFLPMTGNTLELDPGWFSPQLMMATRDLQVFNLYGEAKLTGTVDGPLFPSNATALFAGAIGTDVVTGSADPWTHTISQANLLPSFTIEKNVGNFQSLQFAGCRVGKLSLKAPVTNEPVSVSYDVSGQSVSVLNTPTAVSVVNESPFVFAEASLTLNSNARADVSNLQIDIDNGLKETYTYSGNHGPSYITPVTLHVSGTATVVFSSLNDAVYGDFNTMTAGTLGALVFVVAHPGSPLHNVTVTLPQVVLNKVGQDIKMTDVVMSTINFEASKSLVSGYTIQAIVKNAVSTAY